MKKIILSALFLASAVTFAQESNPVSGSVDTYYAHKFSYRVQELQVS